MSTALMLAECYNFTRKQGEIRADFLGEVALALSLLRTEKVDSILRLGRDLHFKVLPSLCNTPSHTPSPPPPAHWASANTCGFTSHHTSRWGFLQFSHQAFSF